VAPSLPVCFFLHHVHGRHHVTTSNKIVGLEHSTFRGRDLAAILIFGSVRITAVDVGHLWPSTTRHGRRPHPWRHHVVRIFLRRRPRGLARLCRRVNLRVHTRQDGQVPAVVRSSVVRRFGRRNVAGGKGVLGWAANRADVAVCKNVRGFLRIFHVVGHCVLWAGQIAGSHAVLVQRRRAGGATGQGERLETRQVVRGAFGKAL